MQPQIGKFYRHYKNKKLYRIMALGKIEANEENMVIYEACYGDRAIWVRPRTSFIKVVEYNGEQVNRFSIVEKKYQKLVRDKIPIIISKDGGFPSTKTLSKGEYKKELYLKLMEEVGEVIEARGTIALKEELADVIEVIDALAQSEGSHIKEIFDIKEKKRFDRGSFEKRIYLEDVLDE